MSEDHRHQGGPGSPTVAHLEEGSDAAAGLGSSGTTVSMMCLGVGGALLVAVSLGPMAAELGTLSVIVWTFTAAIGYLQCRVIARLARRYRHLAGGTPSYVNAALGPRRATLGALASWSYWFAWTPGVVVNLLLAGEYLHAAILPAANPAVLAVMIGAALYVINALGLRTGDYLLGLVSVVAVVPLLTILIGACVQPGSLDIGRLSPVVPAGVSLLSVAGWLLLVKWAFVAVWSSYGGELAATAASEMRSGSRAAACIRWSGIICLASFAVVPTVMALVVGPEGLEADAVVVFLAPANALFGELGEILVGIMLAAGLTLGAHAFIVGSSRTIFQMASDGNLPRRFSAVNRFGAPTGSLAMDATVVLAVALILGDHILTIVAAANVGYVVVFVMLPIAWLVAERRAGESRRSTTTQAFVLVVTNSVLLLVGAPQWGMQPLAVAVAILVMFTALSSWTRRRSNRAITGVDQGNDTEVATVRERGR